MKLKLSHGRSSLHSVLTSTMAYVVVVATMSAMMMHVPTIAALNCPQGAGTITISGDSDSMYAVKGWKEVFEVNCPHYTVDAQTEAALDVGIRQACHADDVVPPVDMGGRSREFDDNDDLQPQPVTVSSSNEFTFTCNDAAAAADKELVQILVAHDALAFVVLRDTFAERCLQSLPGHGLTLDQLRWIYSSYTEEQLVATGWNASSVPNSDHNNAQRKWEALGGTRCFNGVINVAGVQSMQDYFLKHSILPDWKNGETLRSDFYHDRAANNVLAHLQSQQNALGTCVFSFLLHRSFPFVPQKKVTNSSPLLSAALYKHSLYPSLAHSLFLSLLLELYVSFLNCTYKASFGTVAWPTSPRSCLRERCKIDKHTNTCFQHPMALPRRPIHCRDKYTST
jgi:ABC-type phosphate transport system substrate-binding protein